LSFGSPVVLFNASGFSSDFLVNFALSPDDRRFLMLRSALASSPDKLIVVDNWFEELKQKPQK
jgi:hypothetical protein